MSAYLLTAFITLSIEQNFWKTYFTTDDHYSHHIFVPNGFTIQLASLQHSVCNSVIDFRMARARERQARAGGRNVRRK